MRVKNSSTWISFLASIQDGLATCEFEIQKIHILFHRLHRLFLIHPSTMNFSQTINRYSHVHALCLLPPVAKFWQPPACSYVSRVFVVDKRDEAIDFNISRLSAPIVRSVISVQMFICLRNTSMRQNIE